MELLAHLIILVILLNVKWSLKVVLRAFLRGASLCMLIGHCKPPLEKSLVKSLSYFFFELSFFGWVVKVLYILQILSPCQIYDFVNVLSHSIGFVLPFSWQCPLTHKFSNVIKSDLSILSLLCICCHIQKTLVSLRSWWFFSHFLLRT